MAGRREFEQVVAQAPKKYLNCQVTKNTVAVAASASEYVTIYAPSGNIGKIAGMSLNFPIPAGATSGSQRLLVSYLTGDPNNIDLLYGEGSFGTNLIFTNNNFQFADTAKQPADLAAVVAALQNVVFDAVTPVRIQYNNNTNVPQNGTRLFLIQLVIEEVR